MCEWKWSDAITIGIVQAAAVIPGGDPLSCALIGAFFLNYRREAALKYAYYSLAPILLAQVLNQFKNFDLHGTFPLPDITWLTFFVAILIALLSGMLAIGGLLKHVQQKGFGQYVIYRWLAAIGVCTVYWLRL